MEAVRCPKCWSPLQVSPGIAGTTRPCPICGASIQLSSGFKPIPAHRWRGLLQAEPWFFDGGAATALGIVMLCGCVVLALWMAITFLPSASTPSASSADPAFVRSVPVEIRYDSQGIKGRITNNSGIPLSRVAVTVRVVESGGSTPVIKGVYHLEPAGGIERGETVDCQVSWRNDDKRVYARAKGPLAVSAEVSALFSADGTAMYVDPQ
jgi:hypothetical protein